MGGNYQRSVPLCEDSRLWFPRQQNSFLIFQAIDPLLYSYDPPPPMHPFCKPKGTDIPSTYISLSTSYFGHQDSDSLQSGENLLLDWRPLASVVFSIPMPPWLKGGWVSCFSCSFHQMFNKHKVTEQWVPLSPSFSPSWQGGCGGHSGSFHGVRSLYDSRQKQRTQTRTRDRYELQDLFLMAHFL